MPRFILDHFPLIAKNYCDTNNYYYVGCTAICITGSCFKRLVSCFKRLVPKHNKKKNISLFLSRIASLSPSLLLPRPFLWNVLLEGPGIFLIVESSATGPWLESFELPLLPARNTSGFVPRSRAAPVFDFQKSTLDNDYKNQTSLSTNERVG